MAENSKIEWTHHTFNPWIGCAKVSAGCKNCYAETMMDQRYGRVKWGVNGTRSVTGDAYWKQPLRWNANRWHCPQCGKWTKEGGTCGATVMQRVLDIGPPARTEPIPCPGERVFIERPRVFCASLADVFEDRPELVNWRQGLFDLIDQ